MCPSNRDYLIGFWQLLKGHRTAMEWNIAITCQRDISTYLDTTPPLHVLDLANGRLCPQYIILKSLGHDVFGIDIINDSQNKMSNFGYRFAQWIFTLHIPHKFLSHKVNDLVCGDVCALPFVNNNFDLITSVAAFEHFLDVPAVVGEIHRVLIPGGLAWIGIHPFSCLSGGHNLTATEIPIKRLPAGVDAWDHLRNRRLPISVPLNKWRIRNYIDEFNRHFEILNHYCVAREGEHLLTPEIEAELSDYSYEELTSLGYILLARKN